MRTALLIVLAASLGVTLPSDAKGTLNYKGKSKDFAIALKYAHFVKGPDTMDPKTTIRRVILSSTDLTARSRRARRWTARTTTSRTASRSTSPAARACSTGSPSTAASCGPGHREADGARDHRRHREPARRQNHV